MSRVTESLAEVYIRQGRLKEAETLLEEYLEKPLTQSMNIPTPGAALFPYTGGKENIAKPKSSLSGLGSWHRQHLVLSILPRLGAC
jgi:hypothetical protein